MEDHLNHQIRLQWEIMEDIQNNNPHLRFGWDGFVLVIYECY